MCIADTISCCRCPHTDSGTSLTSQMKELKLHCALFMIFQRFSAPVFMRKEKSLHSLHKDNFNFPNHYKTSDARFFSILSLSFSHPTYIDIFFVGIYDDNGICAVQRIFSVFPPLPTTNWCYAVKHCPRKGKTFGQALMLLIHRGSMKSSVFFSPAFRK